MTGTMPRRAPARHARGPATRSRGVFPALDGLRIVAVTAVVATHAAYTTGHSFRGTGHDIFAHLDIGVAIFFVISGFLISREWLRPDRVTGGLPRLRSYARRRALRILPMYWLAAIVIFAVLRANRARGPLDWVRHLLLLQGYGDGHLADGFSQTWSLCVEAAFYVVLPGIVWLALRLAGDRARLPFAAIITAGVLALLSLVWVGSYHAALNDGAQWLITAGYWLPTSLSWFMAGTVLAAVRVASDAKEPHRRAVWAAIDQLGDCPGVCLLVGLCAFAVAITPVTGDVFDPAPSAAQAVAHNVLYLITAVALVIPAVLGTGAGYDRVLGQPVLRYLGRISYSIFLLHLAVLQGVTNVLYPHLFTGSVLIVFVVTWVATLPLAALGYHFVERPAIALGHRR